MGDSREHVLREGNVIVATGDGRMGVALVLGFAEVPLETIEAAVADLRRLLAELRVGRARELGSLRDPGGLPDWMAAGSESLQGIAYALCEAVRQEAGRTAAVVVRNATTATSTVVAVSQGADRRMLGNHVTVESAVGRACAGDFPVVGISPEDLFGHALSERRRRDEQGVAFPLRDGREGIGALVLFGPSDTLDPGVRERIMWYTVDAGPRLAMAMQLRSAETRAMTDGLTGLANRRSLERAMAGWAEGPCALLCVDIDNFKKLNDGFGHAAGDAALKHVARVFRRALREDDVAARTGGEEFALWLPYTALPQALQVAERVREGVETSTLRWGGADVKLTCSVGAAAVPETVSQVANLLTAADAALYHAKSRGRNRVEFVQSSAAASGRIPAP